MLNFKFGYNGLVENGAPTPTGVGDDFDSYTVRFEGKREKDSEKLFELYFFNILIFLKN